MTVLAARTLLIGPAGPDRFMAIGISSMFGAGSAWMMLRIARRTVAPDVPGQLQAAAPAPDFAAREPLDARDGIARRASPRDE